MLSRPFSKIFLSFLRTNNLRPNEVLELKTAYLWSWVSCCYMTSKSVLRKYKQFDRMAKLVFKSETRLNSSAGWKSQWASLVIELVKNSPAVQEPWFDSWAENICWRRERLPTPAFLGFPGGSAGKESACNVGDLGSILGWENPLEEGMTTHSSILARRMTVDRGAWQTTIHGVTKSQIQLSDQVQRTAQTIQ